MNECKYFENLSAIQRLERPRILISKFSKVSQANPRLFRDFKLNGILVKEVINLLKQDYTQDWEIHSNFGFNFDVFSELRAHLLCCDY